VRLISTSIRNAIRRELVVYPSTNSNNDKGSPTIMKNEPINTNTNIWINNGYYAIFLMKITISIWNEGC